MPGASGKEPSHAAFVSAYNSGFRCELSGTPCANVQARCRKQRSPIRWTRLWSRSIGGRRNRLKASQAAFGVELHSDFARKEHRRIYRHGGGGQTKKPGAFQWPGALSIRKQAIGTKEARLFQGIGNALSSGPIWNSTNSALRCNTSSLFCGCVRITHLSNEGSRLLGDSIRAL